MLVLAKIALGTATTLAVATVYTFREGTVRVDVDEHRSGGSHVHIWAPAAVVPMALHFIPDQKLHKLYDRKEDWAPIARIAAKELRRYPNTTFVEVQDADTHVRVSTVGEKIQVDVQDPGENVHVAVPLAMVEDVISQLAERRPTADSGTAN
jgi:hypothetical protein